MNGLRFGNLIYRPDGAVFISTLKTVVVGSRLLGRLAQNIGNEHSIQSVICLGLPPLSQISLLEKIFSDRQKRGLGPLICVAVDASTHRLPKGLLQAPWLELHQELVWSGFRFVEHEPIMPQFWLVGPMHTFALAPRLKILFKARIGSRFFLRRSGLSLLPFDREFSPIENISRVPNDLLRSEVLLINRNQVLPVGLLSKIFGRAALEEGGRKILGLHHRFQSRLARLSEITQTQRHDGDSSSEISPPV